MKIFKDSLGVTELEARIAKLEERLNEHEAVLKTIVEALRVNSKNVVELMQYISKAIEIADKETKRTSQKENVYH